MIAKQGLTELYAPPPDKATTALIVFVHGLFGHPYETWTWKPSKRTRSPSGRPQSSTNEEQSRDIGHFNQQVAETGTDGVKEGIVYWPQDLLPEAIPDARIYTWGYDADLANFSTASRNTIHQHAGNLLSDLVDLRAEPAVGQKTIIFVVHSLGGIIVKAALNLSKSTEGTALKEIAPATSGICFLGTPHRGSRSASIGKIAFQITKAAGKRPNTKILQGLERNSETLDMIGDDFNQTLIKFGRLRIHSFREENLTRRKWFFISIMVVDPDSAKIGHGQEGNSSIPADHSNMTKFDGIDDIGFKRVSALLRRWVGELRDILTPERDEIDCIDSLNADITKLRMRQTNDADDRTFHWLFDSEVVSFSTWLQHDVTNSSPIYWIQGKPGSGKSTLMKFAIKDSRTWKILKEAEGPDWTCASYFFHDRGSAMQKSIFGMLQEVTGSLLTKHPELFFCVKPEYSRLIQAQRTRSPTWDLDSLRSALFCMVEQRETPIRVILFLDALDEHDGDNDTLAKFLKLLSQKADNDRVVLKICLASRSWSVFEHYFSKFWGFSIHKHTESDIRAYTDSQLKDSIEDDPALLSLENLKILTQQITTKASGVFIWVRLVVDQLAKDIRVGTTFSMLERRIDEMPQELKQLYADILRRLDPGHVKEAYIMLQMAISSLKPLGLRTFMSAVNLAMDNEDFFDRSQSSSLKIHDVNTMNDTDSVCLRRLASRSGGLLEISITVNEPSHPHTETRVVQFLHATAKEYIQENRYNLLKNSLKSNGLTDMTGYDLLLFCGVSSEPLMSPVKEDMLYYAKMAELETAMVRNTYEKSEEAELGARASFYRRARIKRVWENILKGIHLQDLLEQILGSKELHELIRESSSISIVLAVAANLKDLIEDIHSSNPNAHHSAGDARFSHLQSLLQVAAAGPDLVPIEHQDRLGMVELLVRSGCPIDENASKLFIFAKKNRRENEVDKSSGGNTLAAILTGHIESDYSEATRLEIAECLLIQGANPNGLILTGQRDVSFLNYCVRYESAAYVRLLLRYGADANKWNFGSILPPSQYAAIRQEKTVIQALKDFGAYSLRPNLPQEIDPEDGLAVRRTAAACGGVCGAIGHPAVTFASSKALAWRELEPE